MSIRNAVLVQALGAVLLLDSLGTFVAHRLGLGYVPVGLTAYGLYVVAGGMAGARVGLGWGVLVGAAAAAAHATVGWWMAARLGPQSVADAFASATATGRVINVAFSAVLGGVLGLVGAAIGRWGFGRREGP